MTPTPYAFALLALAAYRVWKLLADDSILDPLRSRLVRGKFAEFVGCSWCAGWWVALAWWAAWYWLSPKWTLVAAVPFALSAAVAVVAVTVSRIADD